MGCLSGKIPNFRMQIYYKKSYRTITGMKETILFRHSAVRRKPVRNSTAIGKGIPYRRTFRSF